MEMNKVHAKINAISAEIGTIEKDGEAQGFKYQKWDVVHEKLGKALVKHKTTIVVNAGMPTYTKFEIKSRTLFLCIVPLKITVTDSESGDFIMFDFVGQSDNPSDKVLQSAISSGTKYAYLKLFQIPTFGEKDPDADHEQEPAAPEFDPKAVADWFLSKEVGGDKATWGAVKQLAGDKSTPNALINEAKVAGCKTRDQVMSYLVEGVSPK